MFFCRFPNLYFCLRQSCGVSRYDIYFAPVGDRQYASFYLSAFIANLESLLPAFWLIRAAEIIEIV